MHRFAVVGVSCAILIAAPSFAQTPPELENYRWQVGQYNCAGETAGDGAHPFTATYSLTQELNGGVYVERYVEAKTAQHQQPFSIIHLYTYRFLRRAPGFSHGDIRRVARWANKVFSLGSGIVSIAAAFRAIMAP
jgi:hypothetical protein